MRGLLLGILALSTSSCGSIGGRGDDDDSTDGDADTDADADTDGDADTDADTDADADADGDADGDAEECNGVDDDGDDQIDEGDPGGGVFCNSEMHGPCRVGRTRCEGGAIVCVSSQPPQDETCANGGADNDCNGIEDDVPDLGLECDTGLLGECASGARDCDGGALVCNPIREGGTEQCGNGADDDCDGETDEVGCVDRPLGSFRVMDGPLWSSNPPTYSCLEACALLFGGVDTDYSCSTSDADVNHLAFVDGWGDDSHCQAGAEVDEGYKLSDTYDCGARSCSFSAYVSDRGCAAVNYCW